MPMRPRALGDDGVFNALQNGGEVAGHIGKVDAQSAGIAHERGGQVGFDEVAALVFGEALEQRFGVGVVGAEEGGLRAELVEPLGNLFQNVLLGAGHTDVGGGVGSAHEVEVDAEFLTGRFHDVAAAGKEFVAHVAGEGNMHEVGDAELLGGGDDEVAAGDVVGVDGEVGGAFNDIGVFMGFTHEEHDVGALFTDALEGGRGAGDALVDDDGLHVGVVGEGHDLGDGGLHFGHEVVGVGDVLDHAAVGDITVLLDERFGAAQIVFGLRHRTGAHADVDFGGFRGVRLRGEGHHAQTHGCKKAFHFCSLLGVIKKARNGSLGL